ncbi:MAG: hypothetical protein QMD65_02730 [Patescibacteria group bacterium]|nr:hypothetical protein [Patescibacteria group bacterium]
MRKKENRKKRAKKPCINKELKKLIERIIALKKLKKKLQNQGRVLKCYHECTGCHHSWIKWVQEAMCPSCGGIKINVEFK